MSGREAAWTARDLAILRGLGGRGWTTPAIGQVLGRLSAEVDRASWTILGRSDEAALAALNAGVPKPRAETLPGRLRDFVARTLGA